MPWSAAATVVSGLLGAARAKKEREQAKKDQLNSLSVLRKSAEKAGFNPLTAISSPAAAGFGALPSGSLPPLATIDLAQNALTGVADYATGKTAERENRQKVQDRIAELQLERLESGNAGQVVRNTYAATQRSAKPRIGAGSEEGNGVRQVPGHPHPDVDYDEDYIITPPGGTIPEADESVRTATGRTSWRAFGVDMLPNTWFSDAEVGEQRGAEVISNLLGVANTFADPVYTAIQHAKNAPDKLQFGPITIERLPAPPEQQVAPVVERNFQPVLSPYGLHLGTKSSAEEIETYLKGNEK